MPLAPNTDNYLYGQGVVMFKRNGDTGFLHLGNVPDFGITVTVTKEDHYSSMTPTREKDLTRVTEKSATSTIVLEEVSPENINLAFMGDGVATEAQEAGSIDGVTVDVVPNRFVELDKVGLYITRVQHLSVNAGPFSNGETVTGGTAASGKVAWAGTGYLELIDVSGSFAPGETLTGSTSSAETVISSATRQPDAVVLGSGATPSRYVQGKDYTIQTDGGLIRALSTGDITGTCVVYAQYNDKSLHNINALVNSTVEGELLFIGTTQDGPKKRVRGWKTMLTITGETKYIGTAISTLPLQAEYLSDTLNHPANPFFIETTIE
ncbi:hypothetical protein LJC47_00270 [Desulfosarcina sp. OttesenSCG-928-B08]|nr:hypothetical protein [Desulfosarcina sp. OttesenSCG-928-B08]